MLYRLHKARQQVAITLKHQAHCRLHWLHLLVLVLLVPVELLRVGRVGLEVVALHVVKIKSWNEETIPFGEADCFLDCL